MPKLTDKEIRQALIESLSRRACAPTATLEEVQVCNGKAIADIVAVYKSMHCYEIKGETDSIQRVLRQAEHYNLAFPTISLVTTQNHLDRALDICHKHWGIVVANEARSGKVIFRHIRGSLRNPFYRPEIALLSLWRSELVNFPRADGAVVNKMNRQKIAAAIASVASAKTINEVLGSVLAARRSRLTTLGSQLPCT
jgi:hypothetical protein